MAEMFVPGSAKWTKVEGIKGRWDLAVGRAVVRVDRRGWGRGELQGSVVINGHIVSNLGALALCNKSVSDEDIDPALMARVMWRAERLAESALEDASRLRVALVDSLMLRPEGVLHWSSNITPSTARYEASVEVEGRALRLEVSRTRHEHVASRITVWEQDESGKRSALFRDVYSGVEPSAACWLVEDKLSAILAAAINGGAR